jgi:hypothetical protein
MTGDSRICDCCEEAFPTIYAGWRVNADSRKEDVFICQDCTDQVGACIYCKRWHARKRGYGPACSEECSEQAVRFGLPVR